jgi:hypothetical protein
MSLAALHDGSQWLAARVVVREQRLDLRAQSGVVAAEAVETPWPVRRRHRDHGVEHLTYTVPGRGIRCH